MTPPRAEADAALPFRDQFAVVTGGASGIGRATALALARAGARVLVADRDEKGARAVCAEADSADWIGVDLRDEAAIRKLGEAVARADRAPDILVNAAGWDRILPFVETSFELMDDIVAINLLGAAKVTRVLLPDMLEAGRGRIVNVASDAGRVGSSGETIYAGAKGGIIAFTKSLARETARRGIHVNCVCPGPTDTPLFASLPEKLRHSLVRAIPFGRLAKPEEVAAAIAFFAGPGADFVTGQVLSVSGGLTMAG